MIIMCLVILVPLISGVNPIEILGLSWTVFIMPPVHLEAHKCRTVKIISRKLKG